MAQTVSQGFIKRLDARRAKRAKKFTVSITELARYELTVEAADEDEAREKAEARFLEAISFNDNGKEIICEVLERDVEAEKVRSRKQKGRLSYDSRRVRF